jgi:Rieske Fe-S protein
MSEQEDKQGRRNFLGTIAKVSAAAVASTTLLSTDLLAVLDEKRKVIAKIKLSDHEELDERGGNILLEGTAAGDILVIRLSGDKYAAMSNICPHKKCKVKVKGDTMIQCPCHKSRYALDGTYEKGPSKKNLKRYFNKMKDGTLTIYGKK